VLESVVRLLSDASAVHACFVYLLDRDGERLVLRAASEPYAGLVGRIELQRGQGLAWWALERGEPAFIRDKALDDPRFHYVPELEEERFQSFVSVPVLGRRGDPIGVISLHTEAPREFTESEAEFLASSASLVAGAIENARLYDEMRLRVRELEHLTEFGEEVAAADTLDELGPLVVRRALDLLGAEAAHLYLAEQEGERLFLRWSTPAGADAAPELGLSALGGALGRRGRPPSVSTALVAGGELLGALVVQGTSEVDLARAVANHAAVAVKKIEAIERLAEKNLIKDFFQQLAGGTVPGGLAARADRLGVDLDAAHLVLAAMPANDALERAVARLAPGSVFDRQDNSSRALLAVPTGGAASLVAGIRRVHAEIAPDVAIGISNPCQGVGAFASGFTEAAHALLGTSILRTSPRVLAYDDLGAYKYLLRMSLDAGGRDSHREAIARLADYDRAHQTSLLRTLEEFLARRGTISATSDALYIHANTLRQRLRRIQELSGLDLRKDDWLMVEIALKLVRLEGAMGDTSGPARL
jgi:sugar diacid utilization regulator/putative methionine-R-sulfoxide reductase with GAF domain